MAEQVNPGTDEARKAGCRCPVLDNNHGWGYHVAGEFVMSGDCPIHGTQVEMAIALAEIDQRRKAPQPAPTEERCEHPRFDPRQIGKCPDCHVDPRQPTPEEPIEPAAGQGTRDETIGRVESLVKYPHPSQDLMVERICALIWEREEASRREARVKWCGPLSWATETLIGRDGMSDEDFKAGMIPEHGCELEDEGCHCTFGSNYIAAVNLSFSDSPFRDREVQG